MIGILMLSPLALINGQEVLYLLEFLYGGPILIVVSLIPLYEVRAFAIDHGGSQLLFLERNLFRRTIRRELSLGHLAVRVVEGPRIRGRTIHTQVLIVGPEAPLLFLKSNRHDFCRDMAEELASDLGCLVVGRR